MEEEAYHCSFHEEPNVGFQLTGKSLYFDIEAGNEMKSRSLGTLSQELVRGPVVAGQLYLDNSLEVFMLVRSATHDALRTHRKAA